MPNFTPTLEQTAIVSAAVSTRENILISALAGAAKTSTLVLIAEALPGTPILSLAFNRKIAEEMERRLPSNCHARTLNSIGHRTWAAKTGKRLIVEPKKTYLYLKEHLPKPLMPEFAEILRTIGRAKSLGYLPDGLYPEARPLLRSWSDFDATFDDPLPPGWESVVRDALKDSVRRGFDGTLDYDDQLYLPVLFGGQWPRYPLVLADEVQDFSALNHAMLSKLVTGRVIAVGDRLQSIYAFRGSDTQSMSRLRTQFSMTELPLTISFRCPRAVVRLARGHAPEMRWPDWAEEGEVRDLVEWGAADIPDGAAVLCRNNAPLFKLALKLLRAGRGCKIVGRDVGPGLLKLLKDLGPVTLPQADVHRAIERWRLGVRSRSAASVADRAECLHVFADAGDTLEAAIAYANHLFSTDGPIQLLTGHKAKGLEWDEVFFLDPQRVPSPWAKGEEELNQEYNLRYVIQTRAKKRLTHIRLEDIK